MVEAIDARARTSGLSRTAVIRLLLARALGSLYISDGSTTESPPAAGAVEPETPPLAVPAPAPSSVAERPLSGKSPSDDIDELLEELDLGNE